MTPGRCDLYSDRRAVPPALPYRIPVALTGAAQLRADGIFPAAVI